MNILDSIALKNGEKTKTIRLCAGDLSKIPPEWNTDFLLISAFPNDYSPTPTSVVGALSKQGINVRKLAQSKMEDLRSHFYCWYSKPMTEMVPGLKGCPFKRLMCFENPVIPGRPGGSVPQEVGTMFRGLTTISNLGSDLRVVSSLLKTGDSGHNKNMMLTAMVNGCANWMLAGLPIETFTIVLFTKGSADEAKKQYAGQMKCFDSLKGPINELAKKHDKASDQGYSFDFYMSYSGQDDTFAKQFSKVMKSQASSVRFYDERETMSEESSWQSKMYENVKASRKVVHFLSPLYLKADECIEQFNISYCLNNSVGSLLAPLFLDESTPLPNYMKSIQWFNCHKYDMDKMAKAVKQIYNSLVAESKMPQQLKVTAGLDSKDASKTSSVPDYDVFISYCHKNKDVMDTIREQLDDSLVVFVDSEELQHGFQWQQAIYESLERSIVIFAVFSDEYFDSAVCREELHLAIASVLAAKSKKYLIPLRASEALKIPSEYERVKSFPLGHKAPDYCKTAFDLLKGKVKVDDSLFAGCLSWRKEGNFETILESSRKKFVDKWTKDNKSLKGKTDAKNQIKAKYRSVAVLTSSKSEEFTKAIKLLAGKLFRNNSEIKMSCQPDFQEHELSRIIESSEVILIILDDAFVSDAQCLSFLNLSLLDCRFSTNKKRIAVVQKDAHMEISKLYPRLIDNRFNVNDSEWEKMDLGKSFGLSKGQINCLAAALLFNLGEKEEKEMLADGRVPVLRNPFAEL